MSSFTQDRPREPLFHFDSGWLFLLPGLAVLCATILIPALDDVRDAQWKRDRVLSIEKHRLQRLQNYIDYLDALDHSDESVVRSLAASQLNLVPVDAQLLAPPGDPARLNASVFPELEPDPLVLADAPPRRERSLLARLATDEHSRLWMIGGGAICILIGLLCGVGTPSAASDPLSDPSHDEPS